VSCFIFLWSTQARIPKARRAWEDQEIEHLAIYN
jgi:hypothetical protein